MRISAKPLMKTFALQADEEGEATVTIRQATFADEKHLGELSAKRIQHWDDQQVGSIKVEQEFNWREEVAWRIYYTIEDMSGIYIADSKGNDVPLMEFAQRGSIMRPKSKDHFNARIGILPTTVVDEIHEYVLEMNPQWASSNTEGEE
jgi:hypothetical protein